MAEAKAAIIINNKSKKADIIEWAKQTNHVQWLKDKAAEMVEHKVYPQIVNAEGKKVDDVSKEPTIVMKPMSFIGIKKAVMDEFFKTKKKEKTFLEEIAEL